MRLLTLAFAAVMLCGCNMVVSQTPMFTEADSVGAPPLRPGVWAFPEPDCHFTETSPVARWPSCANAGFVRPREVVGVERDGQPPQTVPYILASGDPLILQVQDPNAEDAAKPTYFYMSIRPDRRDAQGRITAFHGSFVACGPAPPRGDGPNQTFVSNAPFPGLTIEGNTCFATTPEALRNAAQLTEQLPNRTDSDVVRSRWIRDGER